MTAAFDFDGTGGPRGTFDWLVKSGESFTFDTATTTSRVARKLGISPVGVVSEADRGSS